MEEPCLFTQNSPAAWTPCTCRNEGCLSCQRCVRWGLRLRDLTAHLSDVGFRTGPRAHLPWGLIQRMFITCVTTVIITCGRHDPRLQIRVHGPVSETRLGVVGYERGFTAGHLGSSLEEWASGVGCSGLSSCHSLHFALFLISISPLRWLSYSGRMAATVFCFTPSCAEEGGGGRMVHSSGKNPAAWLRQNESLRMGSVLLQTNQRAVQCERRMDFQRTRL